MTTIMINGEVVEGDAGRVGALDAGLQHAVGLFETMLATRGDGGVEVHDVRAHLARLDRSARELKLSESLSLEALERDVRACAAASGLERARVRLTVTGGDLNLLRGEGGHAPTVLVVAQAAPAYPAEMFDRGVRVTVADARANPLNPLEGHKTLSYWWRLRELQGAASKGAAEGLVLSITNHVVGGCVSNLFAVRGGRLITPVARGQEGPASIPSPVLPGITRGRVLVEAEGRGIPVEHRMVSIEDVLGAEEVFLTNSSWGVLPVVAVEGAVIASGKPGTMTRHMIDQLGR